MCRICIVQIQPSLHIRDVQDLHSPVVQIQPKKPVLDHADDTAPTRQHELDHTDHTDHTDQEYICPAWQI